MAYFGIKFTFKGNGGKTFVSGFCDEMKCYNDVDIKEAELHRSLLESCLPPSKWFSKESYSKAIYHLKKKNVDAALKDLDVLPTDTQAELCILIFQQVFLKIIKGAPKLLSDALPCTYI